MIVSVDVVTALLGFSVKDHGAKFPKERSSSNKNDLNVVVVVVEAVVVLVDVVVVEVVVVLVVVVLVVVVLVVVVLVVVVIVDEFVVVLVVVEVLGDSCEIVEMGDVNV